MGKETYISTRWMNGHGGIKVIVLVGMTAFCLFEFFLQYQFRIFQEYESGFLSYKWLLLIVVGFWCVCFLILTFNYDDLLLGGLLFIAILAFYINYMASSRSADAIVLLAGVMLCKSVRFCLQNGRCKVDVGTFLICVVILLTVSAWWHLGLERSFYPKLRWAGLWEGPNIYGMLMGVGGLLAIGFQAGIRQEESRIRRLVRIFLIVAVFMLGVGLVMSYSRGAWLATASGLFYLAWCYGRLKWKYAVTVMGLVAFGVGLLWGRTPDSAPWYVKRADFGRPSAQHRASAWRAGLEIMRDHPFGVGWNNAVTIYGKNYSPPEGGAAALSTNDYLMIGTELGIPALFCFVSYAALCLRGKPRIDTEAGRIQVVCRAGAIVFLVAFWFDGGLFKLPTGGLFWVLLELGKVDSTSRRFRAGFNPRIWLKITSMNSPRASNQPRLKGHCPQMINNVYL